MNPAPSANPSQPDSNRPTCWIVTDGAIGNLKQAQAIAHYLELEPEIFVVELRQPWESIAPWLSRGGRAAIKGELGERLNGPLPEMIITAGRRSALVSLTASRIAKNPLFTVHVLNPRINSRHFDLVVCPKHDRYQGKNVIEMLGAPHIMDASTLSAARAQWPELEKCPSPRVAVLIGASNKAFEINETYLSELFTAARRIAGETGTLLVTPSGRTPRPLTAWLAETCSQLGERCQLWTGTQPNPYLGYLAWADHIVVSADSVNMISEALGTGRPVYCTPPGPGTAKFRRFLDGLRTRGMIHELDETVSGADQESTEPLRETEAVARIIADKMTQMKIGHE